jgi:hypothetical protein
MVAHSPGNIILGESFILACMAFRLPRYDGNNLGDTALKELKERALWCTNIFASPNYQHNGDILRRPDLARISAFDAIMLLLRRDLQEPYDILAIMGNTCLYHTRLDSYCARDTGITLSKGIWSQYLLAGNQLPQLAHLPDQTHQTVTYWCTCSWHCMPFRFSPRF